MLETECIARYEWNECYVQYYKLNVFITTLLICPRNNLIFYVEQMLICISKKKMKHPRASWQLLIE